MTEIDDIERRMDKVEAKVAEMDKTMAVFNVYKDTIDNNSLSIRKLETSNAILDRLATAMDKVSTAVSEIQIALVNMNNKLSSNSEDINGIKNDIASLKKDVVAVDDKGKFDFIKFLKDNAIGILLGGGIAYTLSLLMEALSKSPR
jgi:chromosome segregation ATPase